MISNAAVELMNAKKQGAVSMTRTTMFLMTLVWGSLLLAGCHDSAPDPGAALTSDAMATGDSTTGSDATSGSDSADAALLTCTPNTTTCEDNRLVSCNSSGVALVFVCDGGCTAAGQCMAAETVCTPGNRACEGDVVVECNALGTAAEPAEKCDFGCDTGTATCKAPACAPGQTRCSADTPNLVETCNASQTEWSASPIICPLGCNDGTCTVGVCTPGETRCGGGGVETCGQLGLAYSLTESCEHGCVGDDTSPACASCPAGAMRCDGGIPQSCADPAAGWMDAPACAADTICSEGACVAAVVLPSDADATYLALVKAFVDCWVNNTSGLCSAIDSTGQAAPITLNDIKAWFCAGSGDAGFAAQFEDQDEYFLASDVLGACAATDPTNEQDTSFNVTSIAPGESGVTCIGFSDDTTLSSPNGREVIVDQCSAF